MKIEIDGKEYGFTWGIEVFRSYADDFGISRVEEAYLHILESLSNQYKFYYYALENAIKLNDESAELPFTYRKFCHVLGGKPKEYHDELIDSFRNSTISGQSMNEYYEKISAIIEEANRGQSDEVVEDKKKDAQK